MDPTRLEKLKHAFESSSNRECESEVPDSRRFHDLQVYQAELEAQFNELLETEQKLERSQERSQNIIDAIPVGVILIDKVENITHINSIAEEALETKAYKALNRNLLSFFELADKTALMTWLLDGNKEIFEVQLKKGLWYKLSQVPFSADETLICLDNITKEKEAIERLTQAKEITTQSTSDIQSLTSSLNYELRTPLNNVLGIFQLLKLETKNKKHNQLLGEGLTSLDSLLTLLDDLVDLSKIRTGELQVTNVNLDLEKLAMEVCENLQFSLHSQGNSIVIENELTTRSFYAASKIIQQILIHLIGNANKYSENSAILVTLSQCTKEPQKNIVDVLIKVKDNGIGVDKNAIKDVFDDFHLASKAGHFNKDASGLALSVTKELVHLLNGSIKAKSELGAGSEFCVQLPLQLTTDVSLVDLDKLEIDKPVLNGKLIYIVDDNPINLEVLYRMVKRTGADIQRFKNAHDLITAYQINVPELILSDVQMPEMDGLELVKYLRREGYKKPVVAITANATNKDKERYVEGGFDHTIAKPILLPELYQVLTIYMKQA